MTTPAASATISVRASVVPVTAGPAVRQRRARSPAGWTRLRDAKIVEPPVLALAGSFALVYLPGVITE